MACRASFESSHLMSCGRQHLCQARGLVLTCKLVAVDRLSTSAIVVSEVTTLEHELQRWRRCQTYLFVEEPKGTRTQPPLVLSQ